MEKQLIVFIDSGDTLVDESSQVFDSDGYVIHAELFQGAKEALYWMRENGFRVALVADGYTRSFQNVYNLLGLDHLFEQWIISEELGVQKPHPLMFETAMEQMGLTCADKNRIVMIGNNLKRDVLGANRMGLTSILISESPRYCMQPESPEEVPDYVVSSPKELPALLTVLDMQVRNRSILKAHSG